MGTKAPCIKCGKENWVNTTKLKNIRATLGIRPKLWLKNNYVCNDCKHRANLIRESTPDAIHDKIAQFSAECKQICNGLYTDTNVDFQQKYKSVLERLNQKMISAGISKFNLIKFKNVIVGIELSIPIIGKIKIDLI